MKASILLIATVLLTSMIFAQEFAIRQASNIRFGGMSIKGNYNQTFVIWEDAANGNTQIFAQKLNANGETLWSEPISFGQADIYNCVEAAVRSSDNANLVLYSTFVNITRTVYLAKFDDNGNNLWTGAPVVVYSGTDTSPSFSMTANAVGGAYIIYTNDFQVTHIRGINIDAAGNHLWEPSGHVLANFSSEVRVQSTHPDGQGGVIVNCYLWDNNRTYSTHLIRFSANAEVVGPNPLVPYDAFSMPLKNSLITSDGNILLYGFIYPDYDVLRMQKIDLQGNPLGETVAYDLLSTGQGKQIELCPNLSGGVAVAWRYQVDQTFYTIAQNFNTNLQAQWEPTGVLIHNPSFDYYDLNLVTDEAGGVWLNSCERIFYVNSTGNSVFGETGLDYSPYSFKQPLMICGGNNLSLYWREEYNRQLSLNRQVFTTSGINLLPAGGSPIISHLAGFAAGNQSFALGDRYIIIWQDSRIGGKDTKICFQILDANGQIMLQPNGRELNPTSDAPEYIITAKKLGNNKLALYYAGHGTVGFT